MKDVLQRIQMKILCMSLKWYMCQISALYVDFHFHKLFSAVLSCWQLMTEVMRKWKIFFIYVLKLICMPNSSSLGQLWSLSAVINCYQLLTDFKKKIFMEFLFMSDDMSAKIQLSRLIFIFISCHQLLTAFDSWW